MAITSESQIIDLAAVKNGLAIIENAAHSYVNCSKEINAAGDECNAQALSVNDKTMQDAIYSLATAVNDIDSKIASAVESIAAAAQALYNAQWAELRAYRAEQARLAAEREAAARKAAAGK